MNRVYDRLSVRTDIIDIVVEIEYPTQRLLRRRDVVTFRAEHHDWRADCAQVNDGPIGSPDHAGRELVADKQLVDDGLDLLSVQIDVPAPPALEAEVALRLSIDAGIKIVLLAPERIGGILVLKILYQPGPIEL